MCDKRPYRIPLFDYHLSGELMENATFCYLFHEITLSTYRDIKDFVSQSQGAKFQTIKNVQEPNM
jgi:hypothetical protein